MEVWRCEITVWGARRLTPGARPGRDLAAQLTPPFWYQAWVMAAQSAVRWTDPSHPAPKLLQALAGCKFCVMTMLVNKVLGTNTLAAPVTMFFKKDAKEQKLRATDRACFKFLIRIATLSAWRLHQCVYCYPRLRGGGKSIFLLCNLAAPCLPERLHLFHIITMYTYFI